MIHDMKNLLGVDGQAEFANILSTQIAFEQNREIIETMRTAAKNYKLSTINILGATPSHVFAHDSTALAGMTLTDRLKTLLIHIEFACNEIARDTRRGKGNFVCVSSDVAALLHMAGVLTINPDLKVSGLADDTAGNMALGQLIGGQKVIVDPYATQGQVCVGYKGSNDMDAGFFFCPYVPVQMLEARDPNTMQPKMAFKTRYGIAGNPFAEGFLEDANDTVKNNQGLSADTNVYFRKFTVTY